MAFLASPSTTSTLHRLFFAGLALSSLIVAGAPAVMVLDLATFGAGHTIEPRLDLAAAHAQRGFFWLGCNGRSADTGGNCSSRRIAVRDMRHAALLNLVVAVFVERVRHIGYSSTAATFR
jgi:hypothetical protein